MKVTFEGIKGNVLKGYSCIRGYADLEELKEASEPKEYQIGIIEKHKEEIEEFYKLGQYLFFPEIILGCTLPNLEYIKKINDEENFNIEGLELKFIKSKQRYQITIDTEIFKLSRIDGNHRLEADLSSSTLIILVPFCILFLSKEDESNRQEKVIFNNINFKNVQVNQEHYLKVLFSEDKTDSFKDDEIERILGKTICLLKNYVKN